MAGSGFISFSAPDTTMSRKRLKKAGQEFAEAAREAEARARKGASKGGIIGLTERQAGYVVNARRQLEELDAGYFERKLRDRRFDRTVAKAIREGKPLAQSDIDRIVGRYSDRLLFYRGETIARTEGLTALNAGRHEGIQQLAERAGLRVRLFYGPDGKHAPSWTLNRRPVTSSGTILT